jgi:hypothetical protein
MRRILRQGTGVSNWTEILCTYLGFFQRPGVARCYNIGKVYYYANLQQRAQRALISSETTRSPAPGSQSPELTFLVPEHPFMKKS